MTSSFLSTTVPAPGSAPTSERNVLDDRRMRWKGTVFSGAPETHPGLPLKGEGFKKAQSPMLPAHPHRMKQQQQPHRCKPAWLLLFACACTSAADADPDAAKWKREHKRGILQHRKEKTMFTEHILTFVSAIVKRFSKVFELFSHTAVPLRKICASSATSRRTYFGCTSDALRIASSVSPDMTSTLCAPAFTATAMSV